MLRYLTKNRGFFIPFFVFLIGGALCLLRFEKAEFHLLLNKFHFASGDFFIPYLTWLGDGWFITGVTVVSLAFRYRITMLLALANLISSGITHALKYFVFDDHDRPSEFFQGIAQLHLVPGLDVHSHFSFPSGHTTIAFATAVIFSEFCKCQFSKMLLFFIALMIGYTRVYLSQHFFNDIYAGAAIGTVTAVFVILLTERIFPTRPGAALDRSLFRN